MMVIPVSQHKLIKIRRINRDKLTRLAFYCSLGACISNIISSSTNSWLYTSEVLKYYVLPNNTQSYDDTQINQPVFFKNASFGPWQFCWLDPDSGHCLKSNKPYHLGTDGAELSERISKTDLKQRLTAAAMTDFHCSHVQYLVDDDPSDVTTSVQRQYYTVLSDYLSWK
ncbi:hypothetical protein NECAME_07418 [Necator americanus]|uniref:Uncharacterized protein n=1 Tax=Necator americanus TaxID=51031 RepID=W2TQR1_NECAM|nr:hypothetical protein NECAME_07418 [Necator americanus]ETN83357.1 hypothetical protein NECAME_07418 [Necator americanus]